MNQETRMRAGRRTQVLFLAALLGVLVVVGVVVGELAGPVGVAVYAGAALLLLVVGAGRAEVAESRRREAEGRTCSCCTSTHFDPVKVV